MGRALIVEDEFLIAMHAQSILRALGFDFVTIAEDESRASEIVENENLDVVLLDVHLGSGVASEAFLRLCAQFETQVIVASAESEGGLPSGFEGLPRLLKPYSDAEVRDAVDAVLFRRG